MKKLKKVYYVEDTSQGEIEGFFDVKGKVLGAWCCNDANWRGEYMDPLLESFGFDVDYSKSDDKKLQEKLRQALGLTSLVW